MDALLHNRPSVSRRSFLIAAAGAPALLAGAEMSSRERIDAALRDGDVDRPPFTFWRRFGMERERGAAHARATLAFHRDYRTDLVKVPNDFPYPKPDGAWYELDPLQIPFPEQWKALELIQTGLKAERPAPYYVETIYNPWAIAERLSSPAEVQRLRREQPAKLHEALSAIAKSEVHHAKGALRRGAAGIFLEIANAQDGILTREEYAQFSEPYDRMILQAASEAPLNILHLHGPKAYVDYFAKASAWKISGLSYSMQETRYSLRLAHHNWHTMHGALVGGIDHLSYRQRTMEELKDDIRYARRDAGHRLIVAPGCAVPDETTSEELRRLPLALGAL